MLISSLSTSVSPGENEVWFFENDSCDELVIVSNRCGVLFEAIHITSDGTKKYKEETWEELRKCFDFKITNQSFWRIPGLEGDGFGLLYRNL